MNQLSSIRKRLFSISFENPVVINFILLTISFLAHGLLILRLGFYWDDLPYLYVNHSQGVTGYLDYMSYDRPFAAPIFMLVGSIFNENAFGYHLYVILMLWLCAILLRGIILRIWPQHKTTAFLIAALFLVYPGFAQIHVSLIYSLHFTVLALFLSSLNLSIIHIESSRKKPWVFVASLITTFSIFACEYFALLEIVRPLVIYKLDQQPRLVFKKRLLRTIKLWAPYLIIFLIFIIWRIWIFKFPTYQPFFLQETSTSSNTISTLSTGTILKDIFTVTIGAWFQVFSFSKGMDISTRLIWLTICVATFSFIYLVISMTNNPSQGHHRKRDRIWNHEVISAGFISILLAGIPLWATNLSVDLNFPSDRLILPFRVGCAIMVTGLIVFLVKNRVLRFLLLSLIIGLAAGHAYLTSISYLNDWHMLNDFLWQLYWRAPSIEKGTTLLTDNFPLNYYSDNSITAPVNWIYDPENHSLDLNYMFYFLSVRLGRRLPDLEPDLDIDQPYRSFSFKGSTSDLLVLSYSPPSCLHFVNDQFDYLNLQIPQSIRGLGKLTDIQLIIPERGSHMPDIFSSEPEHTWCYYFENAELAAQEERWTDVLSLLQESEARDLLPIDTIEYFPFIHAYTQTDKWGDALELSIRIHENHPIYDPILCAFWKNILMNEDIRDVPEEINYFYYASLNCY